MTALPSENKMEKKTYEKWLCVVRMLEPEGLHLGLILIYLRNKRWENLEVAELTPVCICPSAQAQHPQTSTVSWLNAGMARRTFKVKRTACYSQFCLSDKFKEQIIKSEPWNIHRGCVNSGMKYSKLGEEGFSAIYSVWAMTSLEALLHILYFIQEMSK